MRLAYLSASVLPTRHANGVHVMRMAAAFAKNGHDVTLFSRSGGISETEVFHRYGVDPMFKLELLPWRPARHDLILYPHRVLQRLRTVHRFDLIYGRDVYGLLAATVLGSPVVYESHGLTPSPELLRGRNLTIRRVERALLRSRSLKRVIFISHGLARDFEASVGPFDRFDWDVVIAADGADPVDRAVIDAHTSRSSVLLCGYMGSLYRGRGVETVLRLAERMPDLRYRIVGGSPEEVAAVRQRSPNNLEVRGYVPPREAMEAVLDFDIALAPYEPTVTVLDTGDTSRWMSPMKIFEYMSCARAIVCSDLPVLREILEDGSNALLVPPRDLPAWEEAIHRLATDASLRRRLGERARSDLLENFTWSARASRVLDGLAL